MCCVSFVRIGRSMGVCLGDRTDSASEKQAGGSSLRKLVGGPFYQLFVSHHVCKLYGLGEGGQTYDF